MNMWFYIIGAFLAVAAAGTIYLGIAVGRFGAIRKLSGDRKPLRFLLALLVIAVFTAAAVWAFDVINAVIILLHVIAFFLLAGLGMRLVRRISGKEFKIYWQGWVALTVSLVYLALGYYFAVHVTRTEYRLTTDKQVGTLRIALIADSHLGSTFDGDGFAAHLRRIAEDRPDLLLIAGDFVDDDSEEADLQKTCAALKDMELPYGVWYAYGNHDRGYFRGRDFTDVDMEEMLKASGVHVLRDECVTVDDRFVIAGRLDRSFRDRMGIAELLSGQDTDKYLIVVDHQPNDYENEAASGADLVVSGHSHGGQLFPWTLLSRLVKVDDQVYGYERRGGTDFIVTSGISDWAIQFKTGTVAEYVIIDVGSR